MTTIKDLSRLHGRTALITGASGFLGKIIADTLAELGADLVLVDLSKSKLATLREGLVSKWGVNICLKECNLEAEEERHNLVDWLNSHLGQLNILVHNAAFVGSSELKGWSVPLESQDLETWRRAIEVNLTAVFDVTKNLIPLLSKSTGASVINISSIYGVYSPDFSIYEGTEIYNPAAYSISKGGLIQLTKWLSSALAPNIRVNTISPGGIFRNQPSLFVDRYVAKTLLCRMATENDFRGAIAYLASDLSSYMTGQNMIIDGGFRI